jgi:hypothetical protein
MKTILLAAVLSASFPAASETITLMCRGDALAEGAPEIITGRVVIDSDRRAMLVYRNGTVGMTEGVEHHVTDGIPFTCSSTFIFNVANYGMSHRCEAGIGAKTHIDSEWLIDRVSGHLTVNWTTQAPGTEPARVTNFADCSLIDARPRF